MDRRTCLGRLAAVGALGAAGCLSGESPATEPAAETTPTDGPPGTASAATEAGTRTDAAATETLTPPASTPAPGECEAATLPRPSTGEGLPDPKPYPERPETIDAASVGPFVEAYEVAHRYNEILADLAGDGNCVSHLDASVRNRSLRSVEEGVVGEVETRASYTGATCPGTTGTDTATPLPHADLAFRVARYYVTERFAIRDGVVVECWGDG